MSTGNDGAVAPWESERGDTADGAGGDAAYNDQSRAMHRVACRASAMDILACPD
jgi:hypothetical protein